MSNWDIKLIVPERVVPAFEAALDETASALLAREIEQGPDKGHWELQAIFESEPDAVRLAVDIEIAAKSAGIPVPDYTVQKMPDKDWLRESLKSFQPVTVGPYYIYGSHITRTPPADKIALEIDAATAFGSGEHQTTQGCLTALSEWDHPVQRALDMGCGSGILSMAYAKTFHAPIDAVDIDPESVSKAMENARLNGLDQYLTVWQSDGYNGVSGTYDLVFANILARPLIEMAPDLYRHLRVGGTAFLSGFLYGQESWVLRAHKQAGLTFVKKYRINGWSTLVVRKDKA